MEEGYVLQGGNGVRITPLEATEDGTYNAKEGQAFNPVTVKAGGGSGGGVLVVTDGDESLDKTWQEISDAMHEGKVVVLVYEESENSDGQCIVSNANFLNGSYSLWTIPRNPATDPADLVCASPNDYPVWAGGD